mgnify:CR=1 FL=1
MFVNLSTARYTMAKWSDEKRLSAETYGMINELIVPAFRKKNYTEDDIKNHVVKIISQFRASYFGTWAVDRIIIHIPKEEVFAQQLAEGFKDLGYETLGSFCGKIKEKTKMEKLEEELHIALETMKAYNESIQNESIQ